MIVIATHTVFLKEKDIHGPPHATSEYLNKKKLSHVFIKHRLMGDGFTRVDYFEKGRFVKTENRGKEKRFFSVFQYVAEFFVTRKIVLEQNQKIDLFIGVDPLNLFAGYMLKLFGKVNKLVYFSADFSLARFGNPLMNSFYLLLDKRSMMWANQTWSVSKRIVNYRKSNGLSRSKNIHMPNAPFFNDIKRLPERKINRFDVVIVSAFTKDVDFYILIDVFSEIMNKIPKARLLLIGAGPEEKNIRSYVNKKGVSKKVFFLGPKSHSDMFKILVKSGVGVALYTNSDNKHFRYYSDPMKVRDYMASGLPVLVSGNSSINEEIEKNNVGISLKLEKNFIKKSLLKLLMQEKTYAQMRKNALSLAKEYDMYSLIEKSFAKLELKSID